MGIDVKVKLGHFFTIEPQLRTIIELKIKCPKDHERKSGSNDAFCARCGGAFSSVRVEYTKKVDHFNGFLEGIPELQAFEGLAWSPEYRPNNTFFEIDMKTTDRKTTSLEIESGFVVTDLSEPPLTEKAERKLNDFMEKFKKVYGEDSIKLEFGLYSYAY